MLPNKLRILLLISLTMVVLTGSLFLFQKSRKSNVETLQVPKATSAFADCLQREKIEYLYYEEGSPNFESNNKFGLYVYAENKDFFERAQEMVNSNGGKWGYVLIPYNVKDRDFSKWSRVFDQLNKKELIPVIQLWDVDVKKYKEQTKEAAEFLNDFMWPIKYRYISAYNEPNDAKFWYGKVDPKGYAEILNYTIDVFKAEHPDFFVMNGALNVSAPTNDSHLEAFAYMRSMNEYVPGIFNKLDGWASHPYPQPNFTGHPKDKGRWSIKAYEDELNFLQKELGLTKKLPVFITETGWAHSEGEKYNNSFLNIETVSDYYKKAFEEVWLKDPNVRAVMPFTIRYDPPFDHFSFITKDNVPYKHFDTLKSMKKVAGNPPKLTKSYIEFSACN